MTYYWYISRHDPPADKTINFSHYGYEEEPEYEVIEQYDLRFVGKETLDALFDRYF